MALIGLLLLGIELGSVIWGLLLIVLYLFFCYYFAVGHLTIVVENNELQFKWEKKFLFNNRPIETTELSQIKTVVIDKGQFLRKLITQDKTVYINTSKIMPKDSYKLITFLQSFAKANNVRVINSWREWADKGYLKIAYRINTVVLIFAFIAVAFMIWKTGFSPKLFFILFLVIPILLYQREMKNEINAEE